jgi:hypothetical protein
MIGVEARSMYDDESPFRVLTGGLGSQGSPLKRRWLVVLALSSLAAVVAIIGLDRIPVPRPAWLVLPFLLSIVWLFVAYMMVWRDLMVRVYRSLATRDLNDRQRGNRWFLAFFAFLAFTLGWLSAFILIFGKPG